MACYTRRFEQRVPSTRFFRGQDVLTQRYAVSWTENDPSHGIGPASWIIVYFRSLEND